MSAIWQELDIPPTADLSAIRRAYALRLKTTRPDRDPAGFARLRAAYEAALAQAAAQQRQPPEPALASGTPAPVIEATQAALPPPGPPPPNPQINPHIQAFASAFDARNVTLAADALDAAFRHGDLPIQAEMQMSAGLLELLIRLPDIPLALLKSTARRFNWHEASAAIADQAIRQLQARIAAETWCAGLRRQARSPTLLLGLSRPGAAHLLLGKGFFVFSRLLPPQPPLTDMLSELHVHGAWLPGRFDPRRITQVQQLIRELADRTGRLRKTAAYLFPRWPALAVFAATEHGWVIIAYLTIIRLLLAHSPSVRRPVSVVSNYAAFVVLALVWHSGMAPIQWQSYVDPSRWFVYHTPSPTLLFPQNRVTESPPASIPNLLLVASRAGNTDAMRAVGDILLESAKTTEQTIRAAAWLGAAANRGNLQAMLDLTKLYLNMDGLLYDSLRAFFWSGVACRVSHTAQEKQFCIQEHARATAALFWTNRPILDRQIAAWHPNTPPLPE